MIDYIEILSEFTNRLKLEFLPLEVVEQTKIYIADFYAASFAGYQVNHQFNKAIISVFRELGGEEHSTVLFEDRKYSVQDAAFINAVYAHGADMDDGNKISAGHIGTHVIPAVFALAEWIHTRWENVIVAINVGYEYFNRIAGAAQPALYKKGFHSTGVAGAIACAAACAKLLNLTQEQIYDAVSIAAVQSSGLIIIDESGQGCKPINPGNAAKIGVFSALLASKDIDSPKNTLQSKKGWFNAYSRDCNIEMKFDDLGRAFTIAESYLKLYPSCRHTHSCIDAILDLRSKIQIRLPQWINNVDLITIYIYPSAIKSAGIINRPKNANEAKFSIAYCVAVAAQTGKFGLEDLNVANADMTIFNLAQKVKLITDEKMENRSRGIRGCRVVVSLNDGQIFEKVVQRPKGEGLLALSWEELNVKMNVCTDGLLDLQQSNHIILKCKDINPDQTFESYFAGLKKNKISQI